MQSTFGLSVHADMVARAAVCVVGAGSDSARVNEVAKLCRAVVRGDEGEWFPKDAFAGIGR
jgi:hypothetical protein